MLYIAREERPLVTFTIIAINLIVFGLTFIFGRVFMISNFGLIPVTILAAPDLSTFLYGVFTIFTSMFVHDGFLHIFFNMWALLILGRDVEILLGRSRYIALYFASGVVGGLAYAFTSYYFPTNRFAPFIPAVGASGAVFGVMGAFGVLFPRRPLALFLYLIPIVAPAYIVILVLALLQTLLAFTMPFSSIAYSAHIGGLLMGLGLTSVWAAGLTRYRSHYW
ncbi:MAG: rhomboid family intramembrane serine protease [Nitrososphaerota archaeon]